MDPISAKRPLDKVRRAAVPRRAPVRIVPQGGTISPLSGADEPGVGTRASRSPWKGLPRLRLEARQVRPELRAELRALERQLDRGLQPAHRGARVVADALE